MRLSILSNVNLDMLSGLLKKENEVFQTDGYGEWITYALKKDERLAAFAPECLFLLLDGNALLEGCQDMGSVKTVLDRSEQYIEKLAENYSASYLVVSTIDVRPEHIGAGDASDLAQASGAYWDTLLTGLAERQKNIQHSWPGNIRELENVIERAVILTTDGLIRPDLLPPAMQAPCALCSLRGTLPDALEQLERQLITEALQEHRGNMGHAAQALGISERVMGLRMRKFGLGYKAFRRGTP